MKIKLLSPLLTRSPETNFLLLKEKLFKHSSIENFSDQNPIAFVLSTGRVGTMTLAALLKNSPNLLTKHEPFPKLFSLSKQAYDTPDNQVIADCFLAMREELLNLSLKTGKGYLETSPHSTFLAPYIYKLFPNAKFIWLLRTPINVVRSGYRRDWYKNHPNDKWRIQPKPGSKYFDIWDDFSQIDKLWWNWYETNRWIDEFSKSISTDNICLLKSEDLFKFDDETHRKIAMFLKTGPLDKSKTERILKKQLNLQIKQNENDPVNLLPTNEKLIVDIDPMMSRFGYSHDHATKE